MVNNAPWQKILMWFRRHQENKRLLSAHNAGDLIIEKNERDLSIKPTTTNESMRSHSERPPLDDCLMDLSIVPSRTTYRRSRSTDARSYSSAASYKRRSKARRVSLFSSHNPDEESKDLSPTISRTTTRSGSYVPRNAASSHLRTTAPLCPFGEVDDNRRSGYVC